MARINLKAQLQEKVSQQAGVADLKVAESAEEKIARAEREQFRTIGVQNGRGDLAGLMAANNYTPGYQLYVAGMPITVGMHLEIPLEFLVENSHNPRAIYTEDDIEEMVRSLTKNGQMEAILVYPPDEGSAEKMPIREGHTRWRALQRLGRPTVRAEVVARPANALEDFRQAREINKRRNAISVFDDSLTFTKLCAEFPNITNKELANQLGESEVYFSKAIQIGELPRHLIERMRENKDTFGIAMTYGVAAYFKRFGLEATDTLLDKICEGELNSRQLQNMLSRKEATGEEGAEAVSRRSRPVRRSEIKGGGKGEIKQFPHGRIEVKALVHDRRIEQSLFDGIQQVFEAHGLTFLDQAETEQAA